MMRSTRSIETLCAPFAVNLWGLFAFACACLGVFIGVSYALAPFIMRILGRTPSSEGDGVSQAELEELIVRAVEEGNRPLRARLEAVEGELEKVSRQLPPRSS